MTLEVHAEQRLVTQGIYAHIRHPMYAAAWLWALAQALLIPNFIGGTAGLVSFGALYFWRVREEEAMLVSQFGDEYTVYAARTPRLLPRR
jgi:protein-S-isoprenylcysteine O-methyltransferase Ste14